MKKAIIVSLLFLNQCSNSENTQYFDLTTLKKIEQLTSIQPPPPAISFARVYIIGANDSVSESSFMRLLDVYSNFYKTKYSTFSKFLFDVLNQKIEIDMKVPQAHLYYSQTFSVDSSITLLYKGKGIKGLMDEYCIDNNGLYTLKKENLSPNEINSISYYFFVNQYIRADDDYRATINFKKLASILN